MGGNKIRVAIIDDHDLFANGLASLLQYENDIAVVEIVNNARAIIDTVPIRSFDVILLDINMPDVNGIEAIKSLLAKNRTEKIIMLSTYNEAHLIDQARTQGAAGYLLKNAHCDELTQAIRDVHNGKECFPERKSRQGMPVIGEEKEAMVRYLSLTDREKELLKYMLDNATSQQIAAKLHISFHTVKTHRKNIMRKLELKTPAELVKFIMENQLQ